MQIGNSLYQTSKVSSNIMPKTENQQSTISISVPLGNPNLTQITRAYSTPLLFKGNNLQRIMTSFKYEKGISNLESLHDRVKLLAEGKASRCFPDGTEPDDDPANDGYRTYYIYKNNEIIEKIAQPDWIEQHLNKLEKIAAGYEYLNIDEKKTLAKYFDNTNLHIAMMQESKPGIIVGVLERMGNKKMGDKLLNDIVRSMLHAESTTGGYPPTKYSSLYPIFDCDEQYIY